MKRLVYLLMIYVNPYFGQKCEWVKTIEGVWQGYGAMRDHNLLSDNSGNVYAWGGTADNNLESVSFTYTSPVNFVVSYSPDGSFRWIRTFDMVRDVDVDPDGYIWIITQTELLKLNSLGQKLLAVNHPGSGHSLQSVKCYEDNAYTVSNAGGLFRYDPNGNIVKARTDGIQFTRALRVNDEGLHMLGTYNGINVSIDGIPLPDIPNPCNCIGAFYAKLDQDFKAKCAGQTSFSAHKTNMSAAFVTSTGRYLNARANAYDASEISIGDCNNTEIHTAEIQIYLGNVVVAFADNGSEFFCAHTARSEPYGSRLSVFSYDTALNVTETLEWEGLTGVGITTSSGALYLSGFVHDTTMIDGFKVKPKSEHTYFIAKFSLPAVGLAEGTILPSLRVFPNPFSTSTTIELTSRANAESEFIFTDFMGKNVEFKHSVSGKRLLVDRSGAAPGIYFCQIRNSSGEKEVLRLLVQ